MSKKKAGTTGKLGGPGRPRRVSHTDWRTEEGLAKITGWARDGLNNEQIAHNIGVATGTLYNWASEYSEVKEALKKGKEVIDYEVENELLRKAMGYTKELNKVKVLNDGHLVKYKEEVYFPPDTTAQIFWLKNRKPNEWRDKQHQELTGKDGGAIEIDTTDARQKLIDKLLKGNKSRADK